MSATTEPSTATVNVPADAVSTLVACVCDAVDDLHAVERNAVTVLEEALNAPNLTHGHLLTIDEAGTVLTPEATEAVVDVVLRYYDGDDDGDQMTSAEAFFSDVEFWLYEFCTRHAGIAPPIGHKWQSEFIEAARCGLDVLERFADSDPLAAAVYRRASTEMAERLFRDWRNAR